MVWKAKTLGFRIYLFRNCHSPPSSSARRGELKQCGEWTERTCLLCCGSHCCGCWGCWGRCYCCSCSCRGCSTPYSYSVCWQIEGGSGSNQDSNSISRIPGMCYPDFLSFPFVVFLFFLSLFLLLLQLFGSIQAKSLKGLQYKWIFHAMSTSGKPSGFLKMCLQFWLIIFRQEGHCGH